MSDDGRTALTIQQMKAVFDECLRIATVKNAKYQDSWRQQGWRGNLSRIFEKTARVRAMLWKREADWGQGTTESARDTLLDMINTLAFSVINADNGVEYGHEEPQPRWNGDYGYTPQHAYAADPQSGELLHPNGFAGDPTPAYTQSFAATNGNSEDPQH